jgi:hypothetical protein
LGRAPVNVAARGELLPRPSPDGITLAGTPADKILHMMTELIQGSLPSAPNILFIQSAILEGHNIYTPVNVKQQIMQSDRLEVRGCCFEARADRVPWPDLFVGTVHPRRTCLAPWLLGSGTTARTPGTSTQSCWRTSTLAPSLSCQAGAVGIPTPAHWPPWRR